MTALEALADAEVGLGRYGPAVDAYDQAVRLAGDYGNTTTRTSALTGLARTHATAGRPAHAASCYEQALELLPRPDPAGRAESLVEELTTVLHALGRLDLAEAYRAHGH
ncbi:tetratricopeptide repeat protein [Pseudonocardia kunmingensis]|uniref:tetratricopeptide repeat protein n=1 Tax=Pseudonocardia kunmingensis TaxID=630975 RepID=UPI00114FD0A9